jgi:hypothetical protein
MTIIPGKGRQVVGRSCCTILFSLCVLLSIAPAAAAQGRCDQKWPLNGERQLIGRIGNREVRGYLDDDGDARKLTGLFFYPATWTPSLSGEKSMLAVHGSFATDCSATVTETNASREEQATWRVRWVTSERLQGTRQGLKGGALTISLTVVPRVDCSGRGPWRTFRSPRWPITFAYPVSWRLAEEGRRIEVVCPDPSMLEIGGLGIVLERDPPYEAHEPEPERRRPSHVVGEFITFDNTNWLIGASRCEDPPPAQPSVFCNPARRSRWRNMTVLQGAAGEHRLYHFAGGYAGQGGGVVQYLFFVGTRRVLLSSQNSSIGIDDLGSDGPVLFDGDDVTARLVRSIRPR